MNYVVPEEEVLPKVKALAGTILENAPLAVRAMKEATVRGLHLSLHDRLNVATTIFERVGATDDAQEGLAAFQEKRPPQWQGR